MKRKIYLYYLVTALFWFSNYTYVPTFSPYLKTLNISMGMVGIIVGSYGLAQMILRIPLGILSDSLNKRKLFIIAGIFTSSISALGLYFANGAMTALLARGLAGCAAATWVVFTVLFCSYFDDASTSRAIGMLNSVTFLGQMSAMLAGGAVAQRYGVRSAFLLAFVGGAAALVASLWLIEDKPVARKPQSLGSLLSVASDRNLLVVSGLAIIVQIISFGTTYGFTPVLAKNLGANSFQLGLLTSLNTLAMAGAAALAGWFFAKRFGEKATVIAGFLLFSLPVMAMPLAKVVPVLYAAQTISGFGRGMVFTTLMALAIKKVDPSRRASAMGFFQAIYGIGLTLGPVIVGFLSDSVGLARAFVVTGASGLFGALVASYLISGRIDSTKRTPAVTARVQ